ncbi:MAG: Wzz/FepE/Etk N-terminal domain-containing protein [Cellvibrionaceae bacterium]|nr:Wzz/FepE/Etk N-terminal domain-containing protein [Cellvibrionaceae bacterium]
MKEQQPQRVDKNQIDLFELFEQLWKKRILILCFTIAFGLIGAYYSHIKASIAPQYILATSFFPSSDRSSSLKLTKYWQSSLNMKQSFSTPLTSKYAKDETPFSPYSLFIRFSELAISKSWKQQYLATHQPSPFIKEIIGSIYINYPRAGEPTNLFLLADIPKSDFDQSIAEKSLTNYGSWAQAKFNEILINEISNISNDQISLQRTSLIEFEEPRLFDNKKKPRTALIITILTILGLISGSTIALIGITFQKRRLQQKWEQ